DVDFPVPSTFRSAVKGVNGKELLLTPPVRTETGPSAPAGTNATIVVALHTDIFAVFVPNRTLFEAPLLPKLVPEMVTNVPMAPDCGTRFVIAGAAVTVNVTPFETTPPPYICTLPVVALAGTTTFTLVALQVITCASAPLKNFTVLAP